MDRRKTYTENLNIRFRKDEINFIEEISKDLGISRAESVRNMIRFFRIMTSEDLKFWEVIKYAIPHVEIEKEDDVKKLLEEGKLREAEKRAKEF